MQLGKERALASQTKVATLFEEFERYIKEQDATLLTSPSRCFNTDESGFNLCPKTRMVIAGKCDSVVYMISASDKTMITVIVAVSAAGQYLTPMLVFPGQRFSYNPLQGFPEAFLGRSQNGW